MRKIRLLIVLIFVSFPLFADEPPMPERLKVELEKIKEWGKDPVLIKEVEAQNYQQMSMQAIQDQDKKWIAETDLTDLMRQLMSNACARHVKNLVQGNGAYSEVLIMDNQGALVCMTEKTSDYWQGDEDKWKKAFAEGRGAVFIDKRQYDESAKATLQQISVPILSEGKAIGVITVGFNLTRLAEIH